MAICKPIPILSASQQHYFWERVRIDMVDTDTCWEWSGAKTLTGYGRVKLLGGHYPAHRVAYTLIKGSIGVGLSLDHLCRTRGCCNPAHLEPVAHKENVLRGESPTAKNARRTHCQHGHEFNQENTRRAPNGHRFCRICRQAYVKAHGYFRTRELRNEVKS